MVKVPINGTLDEIIVGKIEKIMKKKEWGFSFVLNRILKEYFGVADK